MTLAYFIIKQLPFFDRSVADEFLCLVSLPLTLSFQWRRWSREHGVGVVDGGGHGVTATNAAAPGDFTVTEKSVVLASSDEKPSVAVVSIFIFTTALFVAGKSFYF